MQRFTLLHDGSEQGWQAAYLAFHVAAQLGAPLQALMVNLGGDEDMLAKQAAQVEVGGHAAGVAIGTQLITEFSIDTVLEFIGISNGLFVPRRLIPDEKTARRFLDVLSCPLWLVSRELETNGVAMLVGDPVVEKTWINYVAVLSKRIQQPLTGLVLENEIAHISDANPDDIWLQLPDFSPSRIATALHQVHASLLVLSVTRFSLLDELSLNCVIYPVEKDA